MRRDPHRAGALAHDPRDVPGVKARDHPQHDHLGLVPRQAGDQGDRGLGGQVVQGGHRGVVVSRPVKLRGIVGQPDRAAGIAPAHIGRPPAREGEQPAAELLLAAPEARQPARDLQPHIARHVLRRAPRQHAQVAQQRRVSIAPQPGKRRLVSGSGCP